MADIDKQELRKLAESQAQEPWFKSGEIMYHDKRTGETHGIHHDDDAFIVAASPETVLALLGEIEAARRTGEYWKAEHNAANARLHEVAEACAIAEQQRDRMRETLMRLIDLQNSGHGPMRAFKLWNEVADQARPILGLEPRND